MIRLQVNGKVRDVDVDPDTPLLWVLREQMGLTGTKYGCGIGECGACTVHIDGEAVPSCTVPAGEAVGRKITTIEGLSGKAAEVLFRAWTQGDVPQCGYCQPGQIMQAAALLSANPKPGHEEIEKAMSNVLCRCGTYQSIREAVQKAAKEMEP
ncbi:MAG: (2Fe-2S)-binding protein [Deltaproteobacteria bacterium HGW-Deltaproteobacteria-21]|nr:MAG: (2Fe-2S)-binding protein [Deltaproteobacteria bacterium HGW-Deltaproteobacteria-21]